MKNRLARRSGAAGAAIALLLVAGCVDSGRESVTAAETECPWEPDPSIETSVDLGWQASPTGDLVVKDLGLLESCMPNADINWSQFPSGADVVQAFGSDAIDIGMLGSSPTTIALSENLRLPIKVVWIQEVIGEAEALVVRDDSITDVADLRGRRVAVPFSSTAHFSLLQALGEAGLRVGDDVEVINLAPEAMLGAWDGDQIDAAWIWNPVLSELEAQGTQVYSSKDTAASGTATYDLSAVTDAFSQENPEFMEQWARAQDHAVDLIAEDPDAAAESIAIQMGVSPDEVSDLFGGYQYLPASEQASPEQLGGRLAEDLAATADFLLSQGSIEGVSPAAAYRDGVDPGPAASVPQ